MIPSMSSVWIVIDLEATCWAPGTPERARQVTEAEIIELGVALVDPLLAEESEPISTFERLVRPLHHPELSAFCTELTGIQTSDLKDAPSLPEVLEELWVWLEGSLSCPRERWALTLASWGAFDRGILRREAQERGAWLPKWAHVDVKQSFERFCRRHKRAGASYGLRKAMSSFELANEGPAHRALSDALGAWRVLCACQSPQRLTERGALLMSELQRGAPVTWSRALPSPINHKPTFERASQELLELRLASSLNHGQGLVLGAR